jgi:hypothetical protein
MKGITIHCIRENNNAIESISIVFHTRSHTRNGILITQSKELRIDIVAIKPVFHLTILVSAIEAIHAGAATNKKVHNAHVGKT